MTIRFSAKFSKQITKLAKKDSKTYKILKQKLLVFAQDPTEPKLRIHKLTGTLEGLYAFSVTYSVRVVFSIESRELIILLAIGSHDQVYR